MSGQRLEGGAWCHSSSVLGHDPIREALGRGRLGQVGL